MTAAPVFLKLGGALLTRKSGREALRPDVLARLVGEIAAWRRTDDRPLVLAHGSGSFAHVAVRDASFLEHPDDPLALARVAAAAARLDTLVVDALIGARLPAVPVPGSLLAVCCDGEVTDVRPGIVTDLLASGLLPVLYGDAAPDTVRGGTVASTEPQLVALARHLSPGRVVLATDVDGVFAADPHTNPALSALPRVTRRSLAEAAIDLSGSDAGATDVTGAMAGKVGQMLALVEADPDVEVRVVSGLRPGAVSAALRGDPDAGGTLIAAD